jgi:hypothetical protein
MPHSVLFSNALSRKRQNYYLAGSSGGKPLFLTCSLFRFAILLVFANRTCQKLLLFLTCSLFRFAILLVFANRTCQKLLLFLTCSLFRFAILLVFANRTCQKLLLFLTCSLKKDLKNCEPEQRTSQEEGLAPAAGVSETSLSVNKLGSSWRGRPFNRNSCVGCGILIWRSRKSREMR